MSLKERFGHVQENIGTFSLLPFVTLHVYTVNLQRNMCRISFQRGVHCRLVFQLLPVRKSGKKMIAFKRNCAALMTLVFFQILVQTVKRKNCIQFFDMFSLDCNIKKKSMVVMFKFSSPGASSCVCLHCNLHVEEQSQYPRQVLMGKLFLGSSGSSGLHCSAQATSTASCWTEQHQAQ